MPDYLVRGERSTGVRRHELLLGFAGRGQEKTQDSRVYRSRLDWVSSPSLRPVPCCRLVRTSGIQGGPWSSGTNGVLREQGRGHPREATALSFRRVGDGGFLCISSVLRVLSEWPSLSQPPLGHCPVDGATYPSRPRLVSRVCSWKDMAVSGG